MRRAQRTSVARSKRYGPSLYPICASTPKRSRQIRGNHVSLAYAMAGAPSRIVSSGSHEESENGMSEAFRRFVKPPPGTSFADYLFKLCLTEGIDTSKLFEDLDRQLFNGVDEWAAIFDCTWLQGLWDETGDVIPTLKKQKIFCETDYIRIGKIPSVKLTCSSCGHSTESYGRSDASIRRCLAVMREECPEGLGNYYVTDNEGE